MEHVHEGSASRAAVQPEDEEVGRFDVLKRLGVLLEEEMIKELVGFSPDRDVSGLGVEVQLGV